MTDRLVHLGVIHDRANAQSGIGVYTVSGYVNGNSVERRVSRLGKECAESRLDPLTEHWQDTPEKALAMLAPRIRAIGERLLRQADELEENARPALAVQARCETAGATSRE